MRKSKPFFCLVFILATLPSHALDNPSFFKGFTHMNNAHYDEAIMYFNISVKANPDYLPAYSHLALCYERKGDYAKATEVWGKYSEFDSYFKDTVITHANLIDKFLKANEHLTASQPNEAIPLLEEIIATDKYPMSVLWVNAAKTLGEIYFEAKAYDKVIELYQKISLYYPKDVTEDILFRYAYSYQQAREYQKAVDIYKKLDEQFKIESEENIRKYKNMVSLCYEGLGDEAFARDEHKEAKEIYEKAMNGFPKAGNVDRVRQKRQKVEEQLAFYYKTEGDTYVQMKEYSRACEYYRKILDECRLSKHRSYAHKMITQLDRMEYNSMMKGFTYYSQGRYEECRQIYQQLIGRFPEGKHAAFIQKYIGYSYAAEKRYRESICELYKVYKNYPGSPQADDALERLGVILWRALDKPDTALRVFAFLAKRYSETNNADDALYYMGVINLEQKSYKRAYLVFQKLIKEYPESQLVERCRIQTKRAIYEGRKQTEEMGG